MSDKNSVMELIDKRHEVLNELQRILKSPIIKNDEERIISLVEKLGSLRTSIIELLGRIDNVSANNFEREYYRTLADYIQLVDGDREEEFLLILVDYAEKNSGKLQESLAWLKKQLVLTRGYRKNVSKFFYE